MYLIKTEQERGGGGGVKHLFSTLFIKNEIIISGSSFTSYIHS